MSAKYMVIPLVGIVEKTENKHIAEQYAKTIHESSGLPVNIYQLIETIGAKRYHFRIYNNDGLKILDSSDQKSFDGYETEIGAKYVAQSAAKDIGLEPGFRIEII